jgi:hypothetical protein
MSAGELDEQLAFPGLFLVNSVPATKRFFKTAPSAP